MQHANKILHYCNYCVIWAICKSRNGESWNGMKGMRGIGVGMQGIGVGMWEIWVGIWGMGVGMRGIWVGLQEIGVGMWGL